MALSLPLAWTAAHVPTYSCRDNCCAFPHAPPISQVVYLKGTGGAEIHIKDDLDPFNTTANEPLDFDLTFRDRPEPGTFTVRVGCGSGCLPGEIGDAPEYAVTGYKPAVLEPFTQTLYRSGTAGEFGSESRVFNTSRLAASACPVNAEGVRHFVITLEDHGTSRVSPIVWGAVVGCEGDLKACEQFTARELIEFPIYIWRNHSSHWTGLPWWLALITFVFAAAAVALVRELLRRCFATRRFARCASSSFCDCLTRLCGRIWCCAFTEGWSIGEAALAWRVLDASVREDCEAVEATPSARPFRLRERLYDLAVLGWAWAKLDTTVHYVLGLAGEDLSDDPEDLGFSHRAFWLFVVAGGNLLPLTITLLCWWGTRARFGPDERFGAARYAWWTRPDVWAVLEIATGVAWFFNFGAGYYVGPSATIVAGLVRLEEIRSMERPWWRSLARRLARALRDACGPRRTGRDWSVGSIIVEFESVRQTSPGETSPSDDAASRSSAAHRPGLFVRVCV